MWFEHVSGEDGYLGAILEKMERYIESSKQYTRPIVENRFEDPDEMFDSHSYPKAACVLHILRWQLGDDLFRKSLNHYLKSNAPGLVHSKDLMRAVEETTGRTLDRFWEQWIYRPGHPVLNVVHQWLPKEKKVKLTFRQTHKMEEGDSAFAFPLDIEIRTKGNTIHETIDIANVEESASIDCPEAPQSVNVDPKLRVLMELEHLKSQDMLLYDLEHGSTIVVRIRAARELDKHRKDRVTDALAKCMNDDPSEPVQVEAAKQLRKIKNDKSKKILIAACDHPKHRTRQEIVSALGEFYKDRDAWDAVCKSFRTDQSIQAAANAARALGRIDLEDAYPVLKDGLNRQSFRETIRTAILDALVDLDEPEVESWLKKYADDPYPRDLRATAIRGLGRLTYENDTKKDKILDLLLGYLKSSDPSIRGSVVSALRSLKHKDAIPHLQSVQDNDADKGIRDSAKDAIAEIRREHENELAAKNAGRLDELEKENKSLKERLDEMEKALEDVKNEMKDPDDESKE